VLLYGLGIAIKYIDMKIIILDDHSMFANGLGKILQDSIPGLSYKCFSSIANLVAAQIDFSTIDLFISDIELPGENIFYFFKSLRLKHPKFPILVISMHNKFSVIKKCEDLNIQGYLLKDEHHLIGEAIESLLSGQNYYSEKIKETKKNIHAKGSLLTPKEEEIIFLIVKGRNNQEIADLLCISYNTIKTHRKNIYKKLNITQTCEIVAYYNQNYL